MKKKQRLAIDDALNSALKPPARKPSDNLNSLLSQYAPAPDASKETSAAGEASLEVKALEYITPAHGATPAQRASAAQNDFEPLHRAADAQRSTPAQQTTVAGFTRVPHELLDRILPTLDTYDQSLLIRLYRLTRGFNKDTCRVSVPTLSKACNISERQIRKSIIKLEGRGFIQRIGQDFGNKDLALRGTTFKIFLSDAAPARRTAHAQQTTPARHTTHAPSAANKVNTQKENTQTQEEPSAGVRVSSRFTIEECRRYAEHLRSTGQGINNPGGYATTIHRTGEADVMIEAFLNPAPARASVDASQCPDCQGSGFWYPNGTSGGVAKCKHVNLEKGSANTPDQVESSNS